MFCCVKSGNLQVFFFFPLLLYVGVTSSGHTTVAIKHPVTALIIGGPPNSYQLIKAYHTTGGN